MSTVTTTRTNLATNPGPGMAVGWATTSNYVLTYDGISYAHPVMVCTRSSSGPSAYLWYGRNIGTTGTQTGTPTTPSGLIPVVPGQTYYYSMDAGTSSSGVKAQPLIYWTDATGNALSITNGTALNLTVSGMQRVGAADAYVAPAGAYYADPMCAISFISGNTSGGEVSWMGNVLFSSSPGTFFDGDTPNVPGPTGYNPPAYYQYLWVGGAEGSASIEQLVYPMQPFQLQMPNGTILGANTGVELTSITGLLDMPTVRQQDTPRGQQDGSVPGLNYVGERVVTVTYQITKIPSGASPETYRALASAAHKNIPDPSAVVMSSGDYLRQYAGIGTVKPVNVVQVQLPSRSVPIMYFGRVTKYATSLDLNYGYGQINPVAEWTCADGLLYDSTVVTASCGLPNPTSGLAFPVTFPAAFGASTGGSLVLNNTGTYQTSPFFVIQGPCNTPTIYNTDTGAFVTMNLSLTSTDYLTIDMQSGVVTLDGTANRNTAVATGSTMFKLPAGSSSVGFGSIDSIAVSGTLTGYLLPTYDNL